MKKKRALPKGLFYHPNSTNIYFKIRKLNEKTNKWEWSSPKSSGTTNVSTALRVKDEAQAFSDSIATYRGDAKRLHSHTLATLNKILEWHNEDALEIPTYRKMKENWLASHKSEVLSKPKRAGVDPLKYHNSIISRLNQFDNWLGEIDPEVTQFHRHDCQAFYSDMMDLNYRASTVNATVKFLSKIFDEAKFDGYITVNPWDGLKKSENSYRQNDPFTLEEIGLIWHSLHSLNYAEEWRTAFQFGLNLGARIKDCTVRRWSEINLTDEPRIIYEPGKTANKANRSKHIVKAPLVDPLLSHLETLSAEGEYITPRLAELPTETLSGIFSGLLRDLKIPMREEKGVKTWYSKGFHSWRHTLATIMEASGVAEEDRMNIIGHADRATHLQYTHKDDERMRKPLEKTMRQVIPVLK